MDEIKELYEKLELYAQDDFNCGEYCEQFLDTAEKIVLIGDPSSIEVLLRYFNEDTDYSWIFECLKGYVEYYEPNQCVQGIVKSSNFLNKNVPDYADNFFYRMLNNKKHRNILKEKLKSKKALKDVTPILERIMKDSKEHENICRELLNSKTTT